MIVAQYVNAVKRIGGSNIVSERRPLSGAQRPGIHVAVNRAVVAVRNGVDPYGISGGYARRCGAG